MPWHWITEVAAVPAAPPQTRTLMISAGHDDRDPGAVANGKTEADIVLDFRDILSHRLAAKGVVHLKDGRCARRPAWRAHATSPSSSTAMPGLLRPPDRRRFPVSATSLSPGDSAR